MDHQRAQDVCKRRRRKAGKVASEDVRRAEAGVQSALDQGKSVVQDLARQASETGRQAMDRAGEVIEGVARLRPKQIASSVYDQGSRSGEYARPVCRATAPNRVVDCRRNRVRARLSNSPALNTRRGIAGRAILRAGY